MTTSPPQEEASSLNSHILLPPGSMPEMMMVETIFFRSTPTGPGFDESGLTKECHEK